jgi:hypothetical protein
VIPSSSYHASRPTASSGLSGSVAPRWNPMSSPSVLRFVKSNSSGHAARRRLAASCVLRGILQNCPPSVGFVFRSKPQCSLQIDGQHMRATFIGMQAKEQIRDNDEQLESNLNRININLLNCGEYPHGTSNSTKDGLSIFSVS